MCPRATAKKIKLHWLKSIGNMWYKLPRGVLVLFCKLLSTLNLLEGRKKVEDRGYTIIAQWGKTLMCLYLFCITCFHLYQLVYLNTSIHNTHKFFLGPALSHWSSFDDKKEQNSFNSSGPPGIFPFVHPPTQGNMHALVQQRFINTTSLDSLVLRKRVRKTVLYRYILHKWALEKMEIFKFRTF